MITLIVELSCDEDGCDVGYAPSIDELTSVKRTRVGAVIAGWTRAGGKDFCPGHKRTERADRVRELAGQGLTDRLIGERLGVSRFVVQQIRKQHEISPGQGRTGRPSGGGGR